MLENKLVNEGDGINREEEGDDGTVKVGIPGGNDFVGIFENTKRCYCPMGGLHVFLIFFKSAFFLVGYIFWVRIMDMGRK